MLKILLPILSLIVGITSADPSDFIPSQVHIALAGEDSKGNSNGMAISYQTIRPTTTSSVKFGTVSNEYVSQAHGTQSKYYETVHHHIILENLAPLTTYFYVVGDDVGGWSKEYFFTSAATTSLRGNFSFAVFADLGFHSGEYSTAHIAANKDTYSLIWHGGDVGYADDSFLHVGCGLEFCYEQAYDTYMNGIEPWASQVPYMVLPGNHEAECHDPYCLTHRQAREKLSNFTAFNTRFRMPSPESGGIMNMHYSFNYANIHFISIDTETGYPGASEETRYVLPCGGFGDQLNWLEADLIEANANREQRPWIFASAHHPMYQGSSINKEMQTAMEDLFYKYGVDVFFTGHEHWYERSLPVYAGVPEAAYTNPSATVHVLIGGAGCDEMHNVQITLNQTEIEGSGVWRPLDDTGEWTVVTDKDDHVGIGTVKIVDDSTMSFEYIRTKTGEVFDSFVLTKDRTVKFPRDLPVKH